MSDYIPPTENWVREQVELYESSGGTKGATLMDTGMPCIIVTHVGKKTGAVRKIPLMTVMVDNCYVLVGSKGGAPKSPSWVHNLRANPDVEIRDQTEVFKTRVREVTDDKERVRLWDASVKAFPPYNDYQEKTSRIIPLFITEPRDRD
ncbi:MAG: nitroreductase family deazaflavin-dependent oxidoreductase [Rhodospirillales bacterium]|jgi:F420H(2)-dependent quinone reductase|nr:nitroreductase family deazaflavin-dependent oxidoreductase [Rhodospirillales bacterium]